MTKVIHIKYSTKDSNEVYIGRAGKGKSGYFGNPIKIGNLCSICGKIHNDGGSTLPCYRKYLEYKLSTSKEFASNVAKLHNKTLMCFCAGPNGLLPEGQYVCHGQVLAEIADRMAVENGI